MITAAINLLPVMFFSFLAFWRLNSVLFMITAGASLMSGLYWYDQFTTELGLTIGLMMILYAFICIGFAFRCIFWKERKDEQR